jgi:hypothetical protein
MRQIHTGMEGKEGERGEGGMLLLCCVLREAETWRGMRGGELPSRKRGVSGAQGGLREGGPVRKGGEVA